MTDIDATDVRACERLVIESAARNDAADWAALGEVFADDATLVRPSGQILEGRAAIVEAYSATPASRMTRHVCANIRIDKTGPDSAEGQTLVLLFIADPPEGEGPRTSGGPAVGEFADEFHRTTEGWRIVRRDASVSITPRP